MAKSQTPKAIAQWAEANTVKRGGDHNKGAKHLTATDVADILRWDSQGLTQQQIAERLGRPNSQGQVSQVLAKYSIDNTAQAKQILRGGAAAMALNIVRKGQPKDQVQALKGLGVLEDQQQAGLTVRIGGGSEVKIGFLVSPPASQVLGEGEQKA